MDSCHIFNFLFGTKKATTELSRCFTSVVARRDENNNYSRDHYHPTTSAPVVRHDKKSKNNKSVSGDETYSQAGSTSERTNKSIIKIKSEEPLSPLKQLKLKIVQSFSPSSTSFSGTPPPAMSNVGIQDRLPTHETIVNCDVKNGTYHATLVQTVEDEEEQEAKEFCDDGFNSIEIVENPGNKLMNLSTVQQTSKQIRHFEHQDVVQHDSSPVNQQLLEACADPYPLRDNTSPTRSKNSKFNRTNPSPQQTISATRYKTNILHDEEMIKTCHKVVDMADYYEDKEKKIDNLVEQYNITSDQHQGSVKAKLRKVDTFSSSATNSSQRSDCSNEIRDNELKTLRDKRKVYVQNLVQSIELNGSFEQTKDCEEPQELEKDNNNNTSSFLVTSRSPGKLSSFSYNKPITFVKPLPPKTPPKTNKAKCLNIQLSLNKPTRIDQLFKDEKFLIRFFDNLEPLERCAAAQVCRLWRNILYSNQNYWKDLINVIDCTQLRREHLLECIVNTLQSAQIRQQQQQSHKITTSNIKSIQFYNNEHESINTNGNTTSLQSDLLSINHNYNNMNYKDFSYFNIDQDDVWRIQELCNRFTYRGSQQQHSRTPNTSTTANSDNPGNQPSQEHYACTTSKSSSIPSQISSTLSSLSISSLISPLSESSRIESIKEKLYISLDDRGFDAICLFGATDDDIDDLIVKLPKNSHRRIIVGRLNNCFITNRGLEIFISTLNQIEELELSGCNELTNSFDLKSLTKLKRLIITDCINIADGLAKKLVQVVHQLDELTIQAYHMTDSFLEYLSINGNTKKLKRLELPNCKEITNYSLLTISKHFPLLQILSMSGSTKISDDGLEILAEQARQLRSLDLSWCPRISDASLECIACDLGENLVELILDRNINITDIGVGYLATMNKLIRLNIRWCSRISDTGLESIIGIKSLRYLSIAGLHQVTARSLLYLVEADQLEEVELTNCPAVNTDLKMFLSKQLPKCNIIF